MSVPRSVWNNRAGMFGGGGSDSGHQAGPSGSRDGSFGANNERCTASAARR